MTGRPLSTVIETEWDTVTSDLVPELDGLANGANSHDDVANVDPGFHVRHNTPSAIEQQADSDDSQPLRPTEPEQSDTDSDVDQASRHDGHHDGHDSHHDGHDSHHDGDDSNHDGHNSHHNGHDSHDGHHDGHRDHEHHLGQDHDQDDDVDHGFDWDMYAVSDSDADLEGGSVGDHIRNHDENHNHNHVDHIDFQMEPNHHHLGQTGGGADAGPRSKWNLGVLNPSQTEDVPGTCLLLTSGNNGPVTPFWPGHWLAPPFWLSYAHGPHATVAVAAAGHKTTCGGTIILRPQPEDGPNDPLGWPSLRRDVAVMVISLFSMVVAASGTILYGAYERIGSDFAVPTDRVWWTTQTAHLVGMATGDVIFLMAAKISGKRRVYVVAGAVLMVASLATGFSPRLWFLNAARVAAGTCGGVMEVYPMASIAEVGFVHDLGHLSGIYNGYYVTGDSLGRVVSALLVQWCGWRPMFWWGSLVVAVAVGMVVGMVVESFWERGPWAGAGPSSSVSKLGGSGNSGNPGNPGISGNSGGSGAPGGAAGASIELMTIVQAPAPVAVASTATPSQGSGTTPGPASSSASSSTWSGPSSCAAAQQDGVVASSSGPVQASSSGGSEEAAAASAGSGPQGTTTINDGPAVPGSGVASQGGSEWRRCRISWTAVGDWLRAVVMGPAVGGTAYTQMMRAAPAQMYPQRVVFWGGAQLSDDGLVRIMLRPFALLLCPGVLWSAIQLGLSAGAVLLAAEWMPTIFGTGSTYNFGPSRIGGLHLAPLVGGALGTWIGAWSSDRVVMALARRNGGVFEPEFRLAMAVPAGVVTGVGLVGFGVSAAAQAHWGALTACLGLVGVGAALGRTAALLFAADSYRAYTAEALVVMSLVKNGLALVVVRLLARGSLAPDQLRGTFLWAGLLQVAFLVLAVAPMYVFGKRARLWTMSHVVVA